MIKVENFYNKNQFLIREEKKVILQSYNSIVAIWDSYRGKLTLGKNWDYSNTTAKHLYLFISNFVNNLEIAEVGKHQNKKAYINKLIKKNIIEYNVNLI